MMALRPPSRFLIARTGAHQPTAAEKREKSSAFDTPPQSEARRGRAAVTAGGGPILSTGGGTRARVLRGVDRRHTLAEPCEHLLPQDVPRHARHQRVLRAAVEG